MSGSLGDRPGGARGPGRARRPSLRRCRTSIGSQPSPSVTPTVWRIRNPVPDMGVRDGSTPGQARRTAPGVVAVTSDLLDQLLDRVELHLAPEEPDEPHPDGLVVQVALEVEEVGLEQADVGLGVEGRAAAQRQGGRPDGAVGPLEPAGVDAVGRQQDLAGHGHVGGGEAELAARARRRGRRCPAPRGADRASPSARSRSPSTSAWRMAVDDACSVVPGGRHQVDALDVEARAPRPSCASRARRPGAGGRSGSPPPRSPAGPRGVDEHLAHEVLGRLLASAPRRR